MTLNPILKVLSVMRMHRVRFLLMGGQACVFYGAAEFSRDTDVTVLAEEENLVRLREALDDLKAEEIAVPPLSLDYLLRGHAVHFRCRDTEAAGLRVDVMSLMRGLPPFPELWDRRTTVELENGEQIDLLGLPDLVRAKKTQRDKDWPQIRRLVEADYTACDSEPPQQRVRFWLQESRSIGLLREIASHHPELTVELERERPLLSLVARGSDEQIEKALSDEEQREREEDRKYWAPLRKELETLRHRRQSP